jgi:replicative DNA helicase
MGVYTEFYDQIDPEPRPELPTNDAAEQALLGAILCDNRVFVQIAEIVRPEDFSWGVHARIFSAISKQLNSGLRATPITLRHLFDRDPALQKNGGGRYLATLAVSAVTFSNTPDYAVVLVDLALRRALISDLSEPKPGQTTLDILAAYRSRLEMLAKFVRDLAPTGKGANAE